MALVAVPSDSRLASGPATPVTVLSGHADGAVFVWLAEGTHGLQRLRYQCCALQCILQLPCMAVQSSVAAEHVKRILRHTAVSLARDAVLRCPISRLMFDLHSVRRQLPAPGSAGAVRGVALCTASALLLVAHASGGVALRSAEVAAPDADVAAGCPQHVVLLNVRMQA